MCLNWGIWFVEPDWEAKVTVRPHAHPSWIKRGSQLNFEAERYRNSRKNWYGSAQKTATGTGRTLESASAKSSGNKQQNRATLDSTKILQWVSGSENRLRCAIDVVINSHRRENVRYGDEVRLSHSHLWTFDWHGQHRQMSVPQYRRITVHSHHRSEQKSVQISRIVDARSRMRTDQTQSIDLRWKTRLDRLIDQRFGHPFGLCVSHYSLTTKMTEHCVEMKCTGIDVDGWVAARRSTSLVPQTLSFANWWAERIKLTFARTMEDHIHVIYWGIEMLFDQVRKEGLGQIPTQSSEAVFIIMDSRLW